MAKRQIAIQVYLSPSITADGYLKTNESPVLFVETSLNQTVSLASSVVEIVYGAALDDTGLIQTVREVNVAQDILAIYLAKVLDDTGTPIDGISCGLGKAAFDGFSASDAEVAIAMLFSREFVTHTNSLVDAATKALEILKTSSVNGADALSYFMGKVLADLQPVTDDVSCLVAKQTGDMQPQDDQYGLSFGKSNPDDQSVSDLYDRVVSFFRGFDNDSVVMVDDADFNNGDGLEYLFVKGVSDSLAMVDAYNRVVSSVRTFTDDIGGGSDLASYSFEKSLSSSATEFDALAFAFSTGFISQTSDSLDALRTAFIKAVSDTQSSDDSFDRAAAFARVFDSQQTQADAIAFAVGMALSSTNAISADTFSRASSFVRDYADAIAQPLDSAYALVGKVVQDAQELSDSHVKGVDLSHSDLQALIDSYDRVVQFSRSTIADAVVMVDDADFNSGDGLEYSFVKQTADSQSALDVFGRATAFDRAVNDDNALNDSIAFAQALLRGDSQATSDYESHFISFGRSFADSQPESADVCAKGFGRVIEDAQSVSDAFGLAAVFIRLFSDAQIVADSSSWSQGVGVSPDFVFTGVDGDGVNESLLNSYAFNTNIGGDFQSFVFDKSALDLQAAADSFERSLILYRSPSDSVIMVDDADFNSGDGLIYVAGKSLSDEQVVMDAVESLHLVKTSDDSQSVVDAYLHSIGYARQSTDTQTVDDASASEIGLQKTDTQDLLDSFARVNSFVSAYADVITMSDSITAGLIFARLPVDVVYANPPPAPVNGWALNHFMVNDSPGGDKFSYVLYRPTPSAVVNSLVVNKNLLNGNLISGLSG